MAEVFAALRIQYVFTRCLIVAIAVFAAMAPAAHGAEHVIHISVDGLNAELLQQLIDSGHAPNFKRFQEEGAWTINGRADFAQTNTLPNHTCMFTGRPVAKPEGMPETTHHGWTENRGPERDATLHNSGNPALKYIASVFDVAHDAGLSTGLYASKGKFAIYDQSYDEHRGAENERGRDKIDVFVTEDDQPPRFSQSLVERFVKDMKEKKFNYVFLHFRDTDTVGHALGWGSGGWMYAARNADSYLGELFKLIDGDEKLAGNTAIIINTDHGGLGYGHSAETKRENYTIPILVWGAGVGRGELYDLNRDTRKDPGDERVDYTVEPQPIRNGDTGNLALSLLGLGPIPGSLINAKQDLRVGRLGDFNLDGNVDAADYVLWRKLAGSKDPRADANRDGKVDEADRELFHRQFSEAGATAK